MASELAQPEEAIGYLCDTSPSEIRGRKMFWDMGSFSLPKLPLVSHLEKRKIYILTNNSFQCFNYLNLKSPKCTFSLKQYLKYFKLCQLSF